LFNTQLSNGIETHGRNGMSQRVRRTSRRVIATVREAAGTAMRASSVLATGLAPRALMAVPARVTTDGRHYPPGAPTSGLAAPPSAASCVGGRAVPLPPTCSSWR
jgi:hypothetical protein